MNIALPTVECILGLCLSIMQVTPTDKAYIWLNGCFGCAGSVEFSDSDEEDENIAGISDSNGGLSSFPVDSWEDTWDDSDAPVSQEVRVSSHPPTLC